MRQHANSQWPDEPWMELSVFWFNKFRVRWQLGSLRRMQRELGFDPRTLGKLVCPRAGIALSAETSLKLFSTLWAYAGQLYEGADLERERAEVGRAMQQLVLAAYPPHPAVLSYGHALHGDDTTHP